MSIPKHARVWPVVRIPQVVVALVALAGLWGCGQHNPVKALRDLGAEVKRDRRTAMVTSINYPTTGTNSGLENLQAVEGEEFEFSDLEELDLSSSQITDAGLESLKDLKKLETLDLRNTAITDAGLKHLKALSGLQTLRLGDTAVTDAGLKRLAGYKNIKENLKELSLVQQAAPIKPRPRHWMDPIRLGIDLKGGTNLVFQVETDDPEKPLTPRVMSQMVTAVSRRINPSGTEEVTVRQVGADRIEVIIPGADRETVEQKKKQMTKLGSLEFAILANRQDHLAIITKALKLPNKIKEVHEGARVKASWRPVGRDKDGTPKEIDLRGQVVTREATKDGEKITEFLVILDAEQRRVTGKFLTDAYETTDPQDGSLAVGFTFSTQGGYRFQNLTSHNLPRPEDEFKRRLAILLDRAIHSAPNIISTISTRGQISGRFSREEIDELVSVLNAGALEVPIDPNPISEFSISPLLGADVQEKGKRAILIAGVLVLAFMLIYYLFAGLVANLCLVLNLILIMGTMALIEATFTLPGLAGLVLTIGMAVDANVLIFERIREESKRGSSLRMAIQNGFARAFTTIVDANVTTLLIAVILYVIGTDQVRGFAVTLFIGIVVSMFTALYVGRLVFDIYEKKFRPKQLKMLSLIGATKLDFIGKQKIAFVCSLLLIVTGMGALFARGEDNLDIDFSGGTMVTFQIVGEPSEVPGIEEVRRILRTQPILSKGLSLERLTTQEELDQGILAGSRYRVRSKEQKVEKVQAEINQAMAKAGHELLRVTMEYGDIATLKSASEPDEIGKGDKNENGENEAEKEEPDQLAAGDDQFAHQVELTFSDNVQTSNIESILVDHIEKIKLKGAGDQKPSDEGADDPKKYDEPQSLFELTGTEGPGMEAAQGQSRKYSKMLLMTRVELDKQDLATALASMQEKMSTSPIFDEVNSFNSSIATEMRYSAITAMLASLVAIVAYIWFRFQRITFGLAAVVALVHDVLIVLGMVALASFAFGNGFTSLGLQDFKINLPMIAAFLTIVGYSLNDTIVVFDRIREVRGKNPALTNEMVNRSLNQTLARTLLTSMTTLIVVVILYAIGGEGIHGFAFCLVVGVIVGTYSSIYVASPVLLWLMNRPGSATGQATAAAKSVAAR